MDRRREGHQHHHVEDERPQFSDQAARMMMESGAEVERPLSTSRTVHDYIDGVDTQSRAISEPLSGLRRLQARAVEWHERRFPFASPIGVGLKTAEEVGEVASAILGDFGGESATGKGNAPAEAADVVISLLATLGRWYPDADLEDEIDAKLDDLLTPGKHRASVPTPVQETLALRDIVRAPDSIRQAIVNCVSACVQDPREPDNYRMLYAQALRWIESGHSLYKRGS
jgi:NTP pyrophosphatase (non-canonical NTP hydrolase)